MSRLAIALLFGVPVDGIRKSRDKQLQQQQNSAQSQDFPWSDPDEAEDLSRADFDRLEPNLILQPGDFPHCHLSESACDYKDLNGATLIYTDDPESKCWNGEPFAFLVHPGAKDKLLFYMPSGGACWDTPKVHVNGSSGVCFPNLMTGLSSTGYGNGIADFRREGSNFKDYTMVSPPYCSGGAHVGNSTIPESNGRNSYMRDWINDEFARRWASKNLDQHLSSLVIIGSSAGSLGTLGWSDYLLKILSYDKASVLMDSYMGVFPAETEGRLLKSFGACSLPLMDDVREVCEAEGWTVEHFQELVIAKYPKVAFAHIEAKTDLIQRFFYTKVAWSFGFWNVFITRTQFYKRTNEMMQKYNKYPNYVAYIISGSWHVFAPWNFWWSASTRGFWSAPEEGKPTLAEWAEKFIAHEPVESQCEGPLRKMGPLTIGSGYCDQELFPKTLSLR